MLEAKSNNSAHTLALRIIGLMDLAIVIYNLLVAKWYALNMQVTRTIIILLLTSSQLQIKFIIVIVESLSKQSQCTL